MRVKVLSVAMRALRQLAILAGVSAVVGAQSPADPGFRVYLWLEGAFDLTATSVAAIRDLGFGGVNAESPADVERVGPTGMPFYVDHAVPKGFLHIRPETFTSARDAFRKSPGAATLGRPTCLRDPAALADAEAALKRVAQVCRTFRPDFVSLTDEPSATRGINPIDWCQDARCVTALPAFLTERWGDAQRAREVWGTHWPANAPPVPVDTEDARRAAFHAIGPPSLIAAWNDTRSFADQAFIDAVAHLASGLRRELPGVPVGLNGVSMPSAFGGFDWEQLAPVLDAIEPYDNGAARDLIEGCARPGTSFAHTYFPESRDATSLAHELWHYFLKGDRAAIFFSTRHWLMANDPKRPTPLLEAVAPLLKELASDALAPWRRSRRLRPQVAILHSMASTRAHWLIDTRHDGTSWFNRLSSYEDENSSEAVNRAAWTALLADLGLSYRFVSTMDLRSGALAKSDVSVLVLPRTIALSDTEARAIEHFSQAHLVLADRDIGLFTHRLERRQKPALDDLFGITRAGPVDLSTLGDLTVRGPTPATPHERAITAAGAESGASIDGVPVLFARGSAGGRAVYLNLRIGSYSKDRVSDPDRAARLRNWIRPQLLGSQIRARVDLLERATGRQPLITTHVRTDGDDLLVAFEAPLPATDSRPGSESRPHAAPVPFVALVPGTFQFTDAVSGAELGSGNRIESTTSPDRPRIVRLRRR